MPIAPARSTSAALEIADSADGWKRRRITPAGPLLPISGRSTSDASIPAYWRCSTAPRGRRRVLGIAATH